MASESTAIFDVELVAGDAKGRPSFQALRHHAAHTLAYYLVVDLLHVNGCDVDRQPLKERRALFAALWIPDAHLRQAALFSCGR